MHDISCGSGNPMSFTADSSVWNMDRTGFNDRTSSAVVRGGSWEVCEHARFEGRCIVLQPGEYPSLAAMGMNNNVSSVRPASNVVGQSPPAYPQRWRSDRSSTYSYGDRSTYYYRDDNGYYSYGDPHRNYLNEHSYDRLDPNGIESHDTN